MHNQNMSIDTSKNADTVICADTNQNAGINIHRVKTIIKKEFTSMMKTQPQISCP